MCPKDIWDILHMYIALHIFSDNKGAYEIDELSPLFLTFLKMAVLKKIEICFWNGEVKKYLGFGW